MSVLYAVIRRLCFLMLLSSCQVVMAQPQPDQRLFDEIKRIRLVDAHSHYLTLRDNVRPGDILGSHPFPHPVGLRVDNPIWIQAWQALWDYEFDDMAPAHLKALLEKKREIRQQQGEYFTEWVMDRVGVEYALVNLPVISTGKSAAHIRQVMHMDRYLNPFRDYHMFSPPVFASRSEVPESLERYVTDVLEPTLTGLKAQGVVALKFATAYMRPLDFRNVAREVAAESYKEVAGAGPDASAEAHRQLEDYLFFHIASKAGELGLPVTVHVGVGASPRFNLAGSNPLLLESVIDDPAQKDTRFVLVHGGWPFDEEAGAMLLKPNVYVDFSDQTFLRSPRAVSRTLRSWMEWFPEKVMFGSDAYADSGTPLADWEEKLYVTAESARLAVAMALSGMMEDDLVSRERALEIARGVLRENAIGLYGLR